MCHNITELGVEAEVAVSLPLVIISIQFEQRCVKVSRHCPEMGTKVFLSKVIKGLALTGTIVNYHKGMNG